MRRETVRRGVAWALAAFVFFSALGADLVPIRVLALVLGVLAVGIEIECMPWALKARRLALAAVAGGAVAGVAVIEVVARVFGDRLFAVNAEHLFVLAPLFGGLGMMVVRAGVQRWYALPYLAFAALSSLLALGEWVTRRSLFGRKHQFAISQREGMTRALVGSEHVLVLGTLLAVAVALAPLVQHWLTELNRANRGWRWFAAWRASDGWRRWASDARVLRWTLTALLVVGCWATGSRAAALLAVGLAAVGGWPPLVAFLRARLWVVLAAYAVAFGVLVVLSVWVWQAVIPGATGGAYSTNYRWALYSLGPEILAAQPVGYLLRQPPAGVWMMQSELRGLVDLVASTDSEIIYAILALGWLGLLGFLATVVVSILAIRPSPILGFAALTMTTLGFMMSLHGWDAMSTVWYFFLGGCARAVFGRSRQAPA